MLALATIAVVGFVTLKPFLRPRDAPGFVVAFLGWAVIGSQARRVLEDESYVTDVVLLAAAAALAASIAWIYRHAEPRPVESSAHCCGFDPDLFEPFAGVEERSFWFGRATG